jgi:hypothetical protein
MSLEGFEFFWETKKESDTIQGQLALCHYLELIAEN